MTREDILRMAREQGFPEAANSGVFIVNTDDLGRILAAERERIKQANAPEIEKINAYMKALAECVAVERERIAAWVEDMCVGLDANTIANGIRNGGNDDIRAFEVRK